MDRLHLVQQLEPERRPVSFADLLSVLRRNIRLIVAVFLLSCFTGLALLVALPKRYEASALVLIDPRRIDDLADKASTDARLLTADSLVVDSEIEIARSRQLLRRVFDKANIAGDPDYTEPGTLEMALGRIGGWIAALMPSRGEDSPELKAARQTARYLKKFAGNVEVGRVGQTYVIEIRYLSSAPVRAAEVANAISGEYLTDSLEAQLMAARQSSQWLRERLDQLQQKVLEADREVEAYKARNDLLSIETGTLAIEQQMAEANVRINAAQAETAQVKAKLDAIDQAIAGGKAEALSISDTVNANDVFQKLRNDLAVADRRAQDLLARYGSSHGAYKTAAAESARLRAQIGEELNRLRDVVSTSHESARFQEVALVKQLDELKARVVEGKTFQVGLRELEQRAASAKDIYQSLLDNFNRATQRESAPAVNARVIQTADIPADWSKPNKLLVAALSLFFGLAGGTGLAFLREGLRTAAMSSGDVEAITGRINLGFFPVIASLKAAIHKGGRKRPRGGKQGKDPSGELSLPQLQLFQKVVENDFGPATEVLRAIQVAVHHSGTPRGDNGSRAVAFASALPDEGKSIVSALFALHTSRSGLRTLLIDWDFRRGSLTDSFAHGYRYRAATPPGKDAALIDIHADEKTGLHFLPAAGLGRARLAVSSLLSGQAEKTIAAARHAYDMVIIDLPPLAQIADNRMIAEYVDATVLVVAWNRTPKSVIARALALAPEFHRKLAGSVLNMVKPGKLRAYEHYDAYYT